MLCATQLTRDDLKNLTFSGYVLHAHREALFPASMMTSTSHFETHLPGFISKIGLQRNNSMMSDERLGGQTSACSHARKGLETGIAQAYKLRHFTRLFRLIFLSFNMLLNHRIHFSMLRMHDPSIFKFSSVVLGTVNNRGIVTTNSINPNWYVRRPVSGDVNNDDLYALARLYARTGAEYDSNMPPGDPRRPSIDALEANVVTFGHRKFQTEASIRKQGDPLEMGTCVVKIEGKAQYGIVRRIIKHRVYDHQLSSKVVFFKLQLLESAFAPSSLLACTRTDQEAIFQSSSISLTLIILKPAVPEDRCLFTYNILELGY